KWIITGLLLPCFYLAYAISNKVSTDKQIKRYLPEDILASREFISTPTAFNTWLWYIMVPAGKGFYIGYRSVFDSKEYATPFTYYPKNNYLLTALENTGDARGVKEVSGRH